MNTAKEIVEFFRNQYEQEHKRIMQTFKGPEQSRRLIILNARTKFKLFLVQLDVLATGQHKPLNEY